MNDANGKNVSVEGAPEAGGFSGAVRIDFEQMQLALAEHMADDEPSPSAPAGWTRDEFRDLGKKKKSARAYARKSDQLLLSDELICANCGSKKIESTTRNAGLSWHLGCAACGSFVAKSDLEIAHSQLEKFAAMEAQFLKANPVEKEEVMKEVPMVTLARAQREAEADRKKATGDSVEIFCPERLLSALSIAEVSLGDADQKKRVTQTIHRLIELGPDRMLVPPDRAWSAQIEELQGHFPNFAHAISDVVLPSLSIAAYGGKARPPPMLLVGAPGIGKSHFAEMLASMLCVPVAKIDMASASMGSTIGGLAAHWSNSGPGEVFKTLAFGKGLPMAVANPVIFLDEIDKVSPDHRYDPLGPLYSLLEYESAKRFEDESLPGVQIDTSYIRWILCANDVRSIPRPILSRVHIIHVREPSAAESIEIRARIFSDSVKSIGISGFDDCLPTAILNGIINVGPRKFKTRSVMAIGKALANGNHRVCEKDFEIGLSTTVKRMGFM